MAKSWGGSSPTSPPRNYPPGGRAIGYATRSPDGFVAISALGSNIDETYIDGISLTHGSHVSISGVWQLDMEEIFDVHVTIPIVYRLLSPPLLLVITSSVMANTMEQFGMDWIAPLLAAPSTPLLTSP